MCISNDDLGPLPEGDRQDALQQRSLTALRAQLPADKFLFRDERVDDKGVDGSLEAKRIVKAASDEVTAARSQFTNCRAQVQLKSTDSPKQNQDGSISYVLESRNLNYLLSGPSPIYFLWISTTNEIRYAWARDEWQRLDIETPLWKGQTTFTVRFRNVLDARAVDAIHDRIIREARLARRIHETLSRSALSEKVVVSIDAATLNSTDPQQVYSWIMDSGMTIVSAGFGRQVVEWFNFINPDRREVARAQLIVAYAQASLGRYHEAQGHISAAALRRGDLSPLDQRFLDYLRNAAAYQTGQISLDEYSRREQKWSDNHSGITAVENRLDVLRQRRLRERDRTTRMQLLDEMRQKARECQEQVDATEAHKLQARIIVLSAEGDDLAARFIERAVSCQARHEMGYPVGEFVKATNAELLDEWEKWEARAQTVIRDAVSEGHPLLIADAIATRVTIYVGTLLISRMQAAGSNDTWNPDRDRIHTLMSEAEVALSIYKTAGNLEGETRAKLLLSDLFELAGQETAATSLAEGAAVVAEAMDYSQLAARARDHIEGTTVFRQFQAELRRRQSEDEDIHMANRSDEDILAIAQHSLDTLELPLERLPVLEREWFSQRRVSRERLQHCRHIQLLQDLTHEQNPSTHFHADPARICVCGLHAYRSVNQVSDSEAVISDFKQAYCTGCPDRSPKV